MRAFYPDFHEVRKRLLKRQRDRDHFLRRASHYREIGDDDIALALTRVAMDQERVAQVIAKSHHQSVKPIALKYLPLITLWRLTQ